MFCEPADLGAVVVRHRRNGHGAELRGESADPEPDQQERHGENLGSRVRVERSEQHDGAGQQRQQACAHDEPRREARENRACDPHK